jgi:hypothetical protein
VDGMTNTDTTTNAAIVGEYLDMWRETDAAARAERIARVFTEDGRHVDPNADARGHDGLAAMMTAVHEQFAGFQMRQTTGIDTHNDQLRFGWELLAADGTPIVAGIDVGEIAHDGRLQRVTGFWGELA